MSQAKWNATWLDNLPLIPHISTRRLKLAQQALSHLSMTRPAPSLELRPQPAGFPASVVSTRV